MSIFHMASHMAVVTLGLKYLTTNATPSLSLSLNISYILFTLFKLKKLHSLVCWLPRTVMCGCK